MCLKTVNFASDWQTYVQLKVVPRKKCDRVRSLLYITLTNL